MGTLNSSSTRRAPWNKGRMTGQKPPVEAARNLGDSNEAYLTSNWRPYGDHPRRHYADP